MYFKQAGTLSSSEYVYWNVPGCHPAPDNTDPDTGN